MLQVTGRYLRVFAYASWREHVSVGDFVVAVPEVARLEPALFHQTHDAVVGLAEADAHFRGQFTLTNVGMLFSGG